MAVFENRAGATPVADASGLIPRHITLKKELDEWEAENILIAVRKYLLKRSRFVLNADSIRRVHRDMFGKTWEWAGKFRQKDFNMGVTAALIPVEIKKLADDAEYWDKNNVFGVFERSVRAHHRLVLIHPFENGNGRLARLVSDIMLFDAGKQLPAWPDREMVEGTGIRKKYIQALKSADSGDYKPLEDFTNERIKAGGRG